MVVSEVLLTALDSQVAYMQNAKLAVQKIWQICTEITGRHRHSRHLNSIGLRAARHARGKNRLTEEGVSQPPNLWGEV